MQSASIHPPSEAQLIERLGGETPPEPAKAAASPEAETPVAETPADAAKEVPRVTADAETPAETPKPAAPKPKKGSPEHRIAEATFHRREAERLAAEARAESDRLRLELEALKKPAPKVEAPPAAAPATSTPKPTWAAMEAEGHTYDEFLDARDEWSRTEILAAAERKAAETLAKEQTAAREASDAEQRSRAEATAIAKFGERLEAERKSTPNFDDLIDPALPVQPWMRRAILVSDIGPKVMLYLNVNPEECRRIANLDPATALYEMGRIEGQLNSELAAQSGAAKPAAQTTNAKAPTRPVGSSARTDATPRAAASDEFDADWVRKENERERLARARRV